MGRSKIYALVGAALFFLPAAQALAADIPEIPAPAHFAGGWYLRGHIGMAQQKFHGLDHESFGAIAPNTQEWLDTGNFAAVPIFGIGIGYQHNDHLRFDLTGEYRGKSDFSALDRILDPGGDLVGTNSYTGKKSEWLFLANAYYDFSSWGGITPYVGAGVGMSYNTISDFLDTNVIAGGGGWAPSGSQWSFAWALHAGASLKVNSNLSLDLGYSFVHLGDAKTGVFQNQDPSIACLAGTCTPMNFRGLYSHDFKLGLRWAFDAAPQSSYYPPVVKY